MTGKILLLVAASALVTAPASAAEGKPAFAPCGVDLSAMDSEAKPGDDFFDYVNGAWAKRTEIAADRTFVGIDSVLNDRIDKHYGGTCNCPRITVTVLEPQMRPFTFQDG